MRLIAFDLETTGFNPTLDRIVEIGALCFEHPGDDVDSFASLVRPPLPIPSRATAIHGIGDEEVRDAGDEEEVLVAFFNWVACQEADLAVAHNARFDEPFLRAAAERVGAEWAMPRIECSLAEAKAAWPRFGSHKLSILAAACGCQPEVIAGAHRALADCIMVKFVWRALRPQGELFT